jgi:hypothetical protein
MGRTKKLLCAVAVCSTAVVGVSASAAFAGEITGSGEPTGAIGVPTEDPYPLHANSVCAFSGLNDSPTDPFPEGGQSQSYGQLVRKGAIDPHVVNPASTGNCNPTRPGEPEE